MRRIVLRRNVLQRIVHATNSPRRIVRDELSSHQYKMTTFERNWTIGYLLAVSTSAASVSTPIVNCFPNGPGHAICGMVCRYSGFLAGYCAQFSEAANQCKCISWSTFMVRTSDCFSYIIIKTTKYVFRNFWWYNKIKHYSEIHIYLYM